MPNIITNTKGDDIEIILIVDESHSHYWSEKSQNLIQGVIGPKLIIEVSATPAVAITPDQIERGEAGYVSVNFEDVVKEGMIKEATVINEAISSYSDFRNTVDAVIIEAAIAKRDVLKKMCEKQDIDVNPLLLVQLPSESEKTSVLDNSKLEEVEALLKSKYGINVDNGKLAVWLDKRKNNIEGISRNDSKVDVLIFKQAIALGWDCPRAQVLVMFRDIKEPTFEIQTVGRIMRMPEQRHYDIDALNKAYVYTNLNRVMVGADDDSAGYFLIHRAVRKSEYKPVNLPSVYLSRIDYGDLTLAFRKLFMEEANKCFGITAKDIFGAAEKKADEKLDLAPRELTKYVISDAVIRNLDEATKTEVIGTGKAEFANSPDEIKRAYEVFAKTASLPYAPVRSHTKIQQAIYDWFDNTLGFAKRSRLDIQRIVVCSEKNQTAFREIIEAAKERFKEVNRTEKQTKQSEKALTWNVPEVEYFNEHYELVPSDRAVMVSAEKPKDTLLKKERSEPEKRFEQLLEDSKNISWWYKNGEANEACLGIPYVDPETGLRRTFFPDYVVQFSDKTIGIYDPKDGMTQRSPETGAKSDALQKYLSAQKKAKGGIVIHKGSGWFIFDAKTYDPDDRNWARLDL